MLNNNQSIIKKYAVFYTVGGGVGRGEGLLKKPRKNERQKERHTFTMLIK